MSYEGPLDAQVVARILRRASELELQQSEMGADIGIAEAALIEAAEEAGMSVTAVKCSIALERLGPVPARRLGDRIVGPSSVYAEGEIDARARDALMRVDGWLVNGHHLRRDVLRPDHGEWSKRSGVVGVAVRSIRGATGEGKLGDFARVDASARDIGDDRSMVRVSVDRAHNRRLVGGTGTMVAVGGVTAVGLAAAAAGPVLLLGLPVAVAAGIGVALTGRTRARAAQREIERVLEATRNGTNPTRLSVDLVRRAAGRSPSSLGPGPKRRSSADA